MKQAQALIILKQYANRQYFLLGEGMSSVVFHDQKWVYKVFLLKDIEALGYKKYLLGILNQKESLFNNSNFFFPIQDIIKIDAETWILIYPYEKGTLCKNFTLEEIIPFLSECWQRRVIFQDIKPENFIRVKGKLKWVDYEPDKFNDNLFLNMAVRAFIFGRFKNENASFLKKICRSAINQFDLPELEGIQEFLNKVFAQIIYDESNDSLKKITFPKEIKPQKLQPFPIDRSKIKEGLYSISFSEQFNPEILFFQLIKNGFYLEKVTPVIPKLDEKGYFTPNQALLSIKKLKPPIHKVSLIIKACVQDSAILYEAVKHIIRQTAYPNQFDERVLALDIRKSDFLREYNDNGSWELLISEAQRLEDDCIIDRFIYPSQKDIIDINQHWFGLKTGASHTWDHIPVASQLFAFDQARNEYILQADCDIMIGRADQNHSFLSEMIQEFEKNEEVLSVGFNIFKGYDDQHVPYFGFEKGGFVPEVRFCLLNRSRIKSILPLPNQLISDSGSLKLSWYRSIEIRQKESGRCSIRGGSTQSFYIHPQNFKKTDADVWFTTVDRVEQNLIPSVQTDKFDLSGSYYNWTIPKRKEPIVVITCMRNISLGRFLRYWYSLISQTCKEWGLVLIDDGSQNGLPFFVKEVIASYKDKVSFVHNKFQMGVGHNTYKAIHYFIEHQDAIVVIVDGDDALIGKNALKNVYEKYTYFGADAVIGKMYRTDKLHPHYVYTPNFINPRIRGGNVWQHLRSFRKYLFDALSFEDLKIQKVKSKDDKCHEPTKYSQMMVFPEYCWDFAYMVPIIEMATNPMCINHFNLYHDRTTTNTPEIKAIKESEIAMILTKESKTPQNVCKGRKKFLPNLKKIEIDITYECNLSCINCNRSSPQAPTTEGMSLDQIQAFIQESIELGKKWELINILGGEPTLHPDFQEIIKNILYQYILTYSPETTLQITSNGNGEYVQKQLKQLPHHSQLRINRNSFKDGETVLYFSPFNNAPIDNLQHEGNDYSKGCWITAYCGIGLNHLGYYPCGVAGGIDRVFELNKGIKSLKDVNESIVQMLNTFCQFCGHFSDYAENRGDFIPRHEKATNKKASISPSWRNQYRKYNEK